MWKPFNEEIKMATFKPVIFKKHVKSDGTTNIKIKVYHNLHSQYIPTRFYVKPDSMSKSGNIFHEWPEADNYNYELGEIIQRYRKIVLQLGSPVLRKMSCTSLKNYLIDFTDHRKDYIDFVQFSNGIIAKTAKTKTANWYRDSVKSLMWFYGTKTIDIRDITSIKLNTFAKQLREKGPGGKALEPGTINNYLRGIRAIFNKCKLKYNDDDLGLIRIQNDPFKKVILPQYRRKRKNIDIFDLLKIRDGNFETFREQLGADVFMMLFYLMGINIKDLFLLKEQKAGRVEYERSKTNTEENINNFVLSIKIEPELDVLFKKYSSTGFLSDIKTRYSDIEYFNKAVNQGLKSICEKLEIQKVTTNWARHTFASIARNKAGISKSDIDFCLGHVNNDFKMADIYIDIDYSIYDIVNRKVLDLLK